MGAGLAAFATIAAGTLFATSGNNATSVSALGLSDTQVASIAAQVSATAEEDQAAYIAKVAANLGVSADALTQAILDANLETIDEKLAAGEITQEQADSMKTHVQESDRVHFGVHGERGGRGHGGPGGPGGPGAGVSTEAVAEFFGIDAATLRTELQAEKSLATIASENGKSRDELKAFLTAEKTASLAEKVAAGDLTQAEADEKIAEFTAELDEKIDSTRPAGGKGGHGPRGEGSEDPAETPGTTPAS